MPLPCTEKRKNIIETFFIENPKFQSYKLSIEKLIEDTKKGEMLDKEIVDCYINYVGELSENIYKLTTDISKFTKEELDEKYAKFKSDLISNSLSLFSLISTQFTQYLQKVKSILKGLPLKTRTLILNYMKDIWIDNFNPLLEKYIAKLNTLASSLNVETYSVTFNLGLIGLSFSFKPMP